MVNLIAVTQGSDVACLQVLCNMLAAGAEQ